jgi:hypothetical protein
MKIQVAFGRTFMRAFTILITIMLSAPVWAEESLLCIADNATGFAFDEKSGNWEVTSLTADSLRYIVGPVEINSERYRNGYRHVVQDINDDGTEIAFCRQGSDVYGSVNCGEPRDAVRFSIRQETQRFIVSYNGSYLTSNREIFIEDNDVTVKKVSDRGGKTSFIAIGRCSAI